jgi:hypothetical protein
VCAVTERDNIEIGRCCRMWYGSESTVYRVLHDPRAPRSSTDVRSASVVGEWIGLHASAVAKAGRLRFPGGCVLGGIAGSKGTLPFFLEGAAVVRDGCLTLYLSEGDT